MDIASAASFLIDRAVKMAAGLHQQPRDNTAKPASVRSTRDKGSERLNEPTPSFRSSSAYRVSISNAGLQKMQLNSTTV
ncbi:MAG: hypothetical protein HQL84_14140 [Magnetococcales bacterium]|nr:hypothetical protein [Magnetococcales bacterium]MBF0151177.1 hypothetical protein [Magnetococcales bacterium]MBF0174623.1 hypothetical protein [Magnetococcales bacterium]MBF0632659.1 hypothetical protein [Magnetococcales bacterium]